MKGMFARLLPILVAAPLGLLAAAPTANADTTDQKFLAALAEQGIVDQSSSAHAIEAAKYVCASLDTGQSPAEVMQDVLSSSALPEFHTGFFVAQSIYTYCSRHQDEIPRG